MNRCRCRDTDVPPVAWDGGRRCIGRRLPLDSFFSPCPGPSLYVSSPGIRRQTKHLAVREATGIFAPLGARLRRGAHRNGAGFWTEFRGLKGLARSPVEFGRLEARAGNLHGARKSAASDLPPMLGTYRVQSGLVSFEPQFPLDPSVAYRAEFRPDQLPGAQSAKDGRLTAVFRLPAMRQRPRTVVQQIYPSSPILPENLLKFYVHFSAPMSRGRIYEHIHLRNDVGKEIELPFLEIDEELWDPAMTRLTLFIDPGRIKRGVRPLEEIGPALETGKNYSLVIDSDWKDGAGEPLQAGFEKRFGVAAPDRDPPDPASWKIQAAPSGTREPLRVTFPEPMDHALAQRAIQVVTGSGREFAGEVTLEDQERRWVFVPANPWRSSTYQLLVPTTIEDLAGNNVGKPFEVDLFEGVQRRLATPTVKLPFEIR